MSSLGTIWAELGLKLTKFDEGIRNAEAKIKQAEQKLEGLQKASERLSDAGKKLTLGITLPLTAAGGAAIKFAMDAEESENLFEVSMGNMADAARKWSEDLSDALGLNEYELRRNVGTFNVMLNSMGMGEQAAYDMATGFTKLAYDMASFYNLKPEEAFQKLQAGITGEIEPLKRLGILVSENTIKTYAYTNGIAKQGEELTEQQKIAARYGVIMEQTAKAQGDLERTMDSTTNRVRILKGRVEELAVDFGTLLIPIFEKGIDVTERIVGWFESLDEEQKQTIINIAMAAAAVGPFLLVLGKLGSSIVALSAAKAVLAGSLIKGAAATTAATGAATGLNLAFVALAGKIALVVGALYLFKVALDDAKKGSDSIGSASGMLGYNMQNLQRDIDNVTTSLKKHGEEMQKVTYYTQQQIEAVQNYTDTVEAQRLKSQQAIQEQETQKRQLEEYKKKIQEWIKAVEEAGEKAKSAGQKIQDTLTAAMERLDLKAQIAQAKLDLLKAKMGENVDQGKVLEAEVDTLNSKYDLQKQKIETILQAYEQMKAVKGEAAIETQRLYLELLKEQKALQDLQNQIIQTKQAYRDATQAKYEFSVSDGTVTVKYGNKSFSYSQKEARASREKEFEKNKDEIEEIARRQNVDMGIAHEMWRQNRISEMMGRVAKYATGGIITRPVLMTDLRTGRPAGIAGEAGPEAVVPLDKKYNQSEQIINNYYTVRAEIRASDLKEIKTVEEFFSRLKQTSRKMGGTVYVTET